MSSIPSTAQRRGPRLGGPDLINLSLAALYAGFLAFIYVTWVSPRYAYLGFPYVLPDGLVMAVAFVLAVAPAMLLPRAILRPSDFMMWFFYYFIYVPCEIVPPLQGLLTNADHLLLCATIATAFVIMAKFPSIPMPTLRLPRIREEVFWVNFIVLYAVTTAFLIYTYGDRLHISTLDEIYTQRSIATDVEGGSLVGYACGFLAGALDAFLIALGVSARRPLLLAVGVAGELLVYAATASRSALAVTLFIPVFYFFVIRRRGPSRADRIGAVLVIGSLSTYLLGLIPSLANSSLFFYWMSLLFMRTLLMPGAILGIYADFFSFHPHTHYTNVTLLSSLVPEAYPYNKPVGLVIGNYVTGSPMDANANLFASDGIAALGYGGVIVIALIAGATFRIVDRVLDRNVLPSFSAASIAAVITLANTSFFTSLLSGGFMLLVLTFVLWGRVLPASAAHRAQSTARAELGSAGK